MSPVAQKQLWQVGWVHGITEGDVNQTTVAEATNVEIDKPGLLEPRDELVVEETLTSSYDIIDVQYMVSDPSKSTIGCRIILTTDTVEIVTATTTVLNLPETIDSSSEMVVTGDKAYIATSVGSKPAGVLVVWFNRNGTRFFMPNGYAPVTGTSVADGSDEYTGLWMISSVARPAPSLKSIVNLPTDFDLLPDDEPTTVGINSKSTIWPIGIVVVPLNVPDGGYISESAIRVKCQFIYTSGEIGAPSNSILLERTHSNPYYYSLQLLVNANIEDDIAAIHVYRKILLNDGAAVSTQYELVFTAPVKRDNPEYNYTEGSTNLVNEWWWDKTEVPLNNSYLRLNDTTNYDVESGMRNISGGVSSIETNGWIKDQTSANIRWFNTAHTVVSGDTFVTHIKDDTTGVQYNTTAANVAVAIDMHVLAGSITACATQYNYCGPSESLVDPLVPGNYYTPENNYARMLTANPTGMGYGIYGSLIRATSETPSVTHPTNPAVTTGTTISNATYAPRFFYMDDGSASEFTLESTTGLTEAEVSIALPKRIAITSGRLLGLNVIQDGTEHQSRLIYSEFRKYGMFSKNNYIDYGRKDDGQGVAIAQFRNRALVLNTSSTYVLDLSGGSDMAWRELGSYSNIGVASNKSLVETPLGVFFGDSFHCYLFDGSKVDPIDDIQGRRVTNAYRQAISVAHQFLWRSDKQQLWIVYEKAAGDFSALVFDTLNGGWHNHDLTEIGKMDTVIGSFNEDGNEYTVFLSSSNTVKIMSFDGTSLTRGFEWGLDSGEITMGAPEIIKKIKRIYVDTESNATSTGQLDLVVNGDDANVINLYPDFGRNMSKVSYSGRGYSSRLSLSAPTSEGQSWAGKIESLGLSYKPKKLK